MGTVIYNGTIVTAVETIQADVLIEDERVALIGRNLPHTGHTVHDATGKLLLPGGIDVHTHLELPVSGTISSDDFFTGQRAAAFGGTTSHIDFAAQQRGGSLREGLMTWQARAAAKAVIDYGFHMTIVDLHDTAVAEIPWLVQEGVPSLKLLLAYKGTYQVDDTTLFRCLRLARDHGALTMVHAENGDVIAELASALLAEGKTEPHHHLLAHPALAETEATCRAVCLAGIAGAPLYVVHMTCAGAVEQLAIGRARGYPIMGETCPQYLFAFEDKLRGTSDDAFNGAKYVCSPPLRTEADAAVLWQALAQDTLQVVGTDHCSFFYEGGRNGRLAGKELGRGNFTTIPNGLPGIEDRMPVLWHLGVNNGRISPNRFVALTSANPAKIFGMYPQKGVIAPGSDADILIWDPEATRTISARTHHMNCDYNIYEGLTVRGWPFKVFSRGRLIVEGNDWLGERGSGKFIRRRPYGELL